MDGYQSPRAARCAADAPTGPVPTVGWARPETSARIETIVVPTGGHAWQAQRVISLALRRGADQLNVGDGICSVVDARPLTGGVGVDLLVPTDARRLDEVGAGNVRRQQLFERFTIDQLQLLLTPVVESLCLLHDAGLAHGGITLSDFYVRSDGRGVLVGFEPHARPEGDVADVAALILDHLPPGSIDGPGAALLTRAVDGDPHRAPTMGELAQVISRLGHGFISAHSWRVDAPPARRRSIGASDGATTKSAIDGVEAVEMIDPIQRVRENLPRRMANRGDAHRGGRRGEHRARRTRSVPWPMVSAVVGSSAATWLIASVVM